MLFLNIITFVGGCYLTFRFLRGNFFSLESKLTDLCLLGALWLLYVVVFT